MTGTTIAMPDGQNPAAMRGYQYKHGDRPLEGYTIQRAAGRGGFGEVYYALSDSGREVALKLIQTYEQIELRGIGHCMNLKSPHLVTVFDVKYGQDGRPWVIMEYVSGPSLRQLLDAAPSGLGTQKAAFFLREIGKGLTYLHDCGIVHRDLKPGNIFYENGYVKIGDYGLSKAISTSQYSGQTVTVGTVHYMAPEIGAGRYDKSIDIYALGALLFEMITGQVPFFGSSPAEVLMKHLSIDVDASAVEEPFRTVIKKAMAKNPADRYQSVQEMIEAVFGSEHVRNSVSHFSPDSLTMVAGHVAQKISPSGGASSFTPSDTPAPQPFCRGDWFRRGDRIAWHAGRAEQRIGRMWQKFGAKANRAIGGGRLAGSFAPADADPLRMWHRIVLAGVVACIVAVITGVYSAGADDVPEMGFITWWAIAASTVVLLVAWRLLAPLLVNESKWVRRLALGGSAGLFAILFLLPLVEESNTGRWGHRTPGTLLGIFISFLLVDWAACLSATRRERVSLGPPLGAAITALVLCAICGGHAVVGIAVLAGTALAASLASGWNPPGAVPVIPAARTATPQGPGMQPGVTPGSFPAQPISSGPPQPAPLPPLMPVLRPVPRGARIVWLSLFIGFATLGLMLWVTSAMDRNFDPNDTALSVGFGAGALLASAFCLMRGFRTHFRGYWQYVFKPLIQFACIQSILVSICMATLGRLYPNDMPVAIFFTVLPALVWFVVTILAGRGGTMSQVSSLETQYRLAPSEPISFAGIIFGLGRFGLTVVGSALLVFSLVVALAAATDLPGLFASGALDPHMPRELDKAFGMQQWPQFLRHMGTLVSIVSALFATALLMLARRRWGAGHLLRLVCGIVLLFAMVGALGRALPDWYDVTGGSTPAVAIEQYFQMVHTPRVWSAAALFVGAMFLLLWPPAAQRRRNREYVVETNGSQSRVVWKESDVHEPQKTEPAATKQK